jgi:sucrose-6F-phosphate phosphohydrolase
MPPIFNHLDTGAISMESIRMIVSDLDGTLLGDDDALSRFAQWYSERKGDLCLVYASGRFYSSILEVINSTLLPEPDAVIASVGTNIVLYPENKSLDGWPRCLGRWDADRIREILEATVKMELQPEEVQSDFKLSYYANGLDVTALVDLRKTLADNGYSAEIVYSSQRDLDVMPAGVHKGSAAAFLANEWGINTKQALVCGDTGNDKAMFMHGFYGVIVGNAQAELKELKSPDVYHSKNNYAAGVMEGIDYWSKRQKMAV